MEKKPVDLDLECFQKRINLGSAGKGLSIGYQSFHFEMLSKIILTFIPGVHQDTARK